MAAENEVEIRVTARDDTDRAYRSAVTGARNLEGKVGTALLGLSDKLKGLGVSALATAGTIAVDLASRAIGKLIDYSRQAVTAASDLGESMNAVDKIFGSAGAKIKAWGEQNASSFGLSQRAFQQMATPLGAMLKNQLGVPMDQVADKTIELTKRAADLASVFNTDVQSALADINSALRGELDPIEKYGVTLNAAAVETEALRMTHKKAAKDLTDTEKAAARLKLILDQTKSSAGDFRATSDGLANSTRILAARQEELQAKIGEKLLPFMQKLNQFKLDLLERAFVRVVPAMEKVGKFLAQLYEKARPIFEKAAPMIRQGMEDIKRKWDENQESIKKLIPFLEKVAIFLGVTLLAAIAAAIGLIEGMIVWLGKAGDAWHDFERGANMAALMTIDAAKFIADALGKIPGPMQQAFKDASRDLENLRNKLIGLDGLEVGIGVNVKLTGLASLSNAISRAIGSELVSSGIGRRASGGVVGAAAGGVRSGLLEVAERGRELALLAPGRAVLPPGSMVYGAGQTGQMMAGAGGMTTIRLDLWLNGRQQREILIDAAANEGKSVAAFLGAA